VVPVHTEFGGGSLWWSATNPAGRGSASALPDYAPVPQSAVHPALNEHGYQVERPEQNVHWITDAPYRSAFVTDSVGVVLLDATPTIGNKI
jgi:hypothetical protein